MRRILTGIKPTGTPHVGNYLGAIRPALRLADDPELEACYFIADYHALTTVHDRAALDRLIHEVAATWLACGLSAERTLFYRQSDIPEIFELAWILSCFTSKGWMNKAHAYKARVAEAEAAGEADVDAGISMGLYQYPVLMAADILAFDTHVVPVGKDQVQHIEIARDIAQRVNHVFRAELLVPPAASVEADVATIPGLDGRKMSKSYDNTIPLFAPPKQLKKIIGRMVTDSSPPEAPKDPETSTVFQLYRLLASPEEIDALRARYVAGIGWGDAKAELHRVMDERIAPARARYDELMTAEGRAEVDALLAEGARRARAIARGVLTRVRKAIGVER
ncbi:MAG: tryptophan--tRNA ligase [Kofleriaceae bacterium]